jgi:hypothetical protein
VILPLYSFYVHMCVTSLVVSLIDLAPQSPPHPPTLLFKHPSPPYAIPLPSAAVSSFALTLPLSFTWPPGRPSGLCVAALPACGLRGLRRKNENLIKRNVAAAMMIATTKQWALITLLHKETERLLRGCDPHIMRVIRAAAAVCNVIQNCNVAAAINRYMRHSSTGSVSLIHSCVAILIVRHTCGVPVCSTSS